MVIINEGKQFENSFKESVPQDMYFLRLKDSASSFGSNENTRFTLRQPFDCLMFYKDTLFPLELKSTKSTSFSFKGSSQMIKEHQIKGLLEAASHEGVIAGIVFNFREPINKVYFLHINNFNKFVSETTKSSINEADIIKYGGVVIEGKLKKVKYKYMIREFIEKIKETDEMRDENKM